MEKIKEQLVGMLSNYPDRPKALEATLKNWQADIDSFCRKHPRYGWWLITTFGDLVVSQLSDEQVRKYARLRDAGSVLRYLGKRLGTCAFRELAKKAPWAAIEAHRDRLGENLIRHYLREYNSTLLFFAANHLTIDEILYGLRYSPKYAVKYVAHRLTPEQLAQVSK